ncbi:RagB/SusD family nutrient uptake outer membrane protein [Prevotella sp.]|uniref:RagB/SusD family nutrient uptake outer membrane protein n=1 Tax=Prevotella sp. TaxID=59823 RepID=UPI002ABDE349|nr:RagB/SusD family nutrient uptake outer membrane protein [Prevotella sp.]
MKKSKILMLALASMSLLSSCVDDADQSTYLTEQRRQELLGGDATGVIDAAVTAMYNDMQDYYMTDISHNYFGQKSFDYLTSLMGNDMVMTGRFGMSLNHYNCKYWAQSYAATANRWYEYYKCIDDANKILIALNNVDPEGESSLMQKYRAEALGFRGRAYLQLSYLYQQSYYVGCEDTEWGKGEHYDYSESKCVPIVTDKTEGDQPLSTVKQVMKQVTDDLEACYKIYENLGEIKTAANTDFDGTVAAMYLARAYMIMHQWDKALVYANAVCDNYPVLENENDLLQGFSSLNLTDVVFGCDITADNASVYRSWFSQMDAYGAGYAAIGVWRAGYGPFVDKIADDDVRLKWFCCDRSTGVDIEGKRVTLQRDLQRKARCEYQSVKFIGAGRDAVLANADAIRRGGSAPGWELGDYIYLRSEEAYFMKMEILAHKNDLQGAKELLEQVMVTRQPSYEYKGDMTTQALIKEINFQKRVEFWGEGIEFLDNRRLNIPLDRTSEDPHNNHYSGSRFKIDQESRQFRYQIPIKEIENNKKLTPDDQN